jgi:hypothetical protein
MNKNNENISISKLLNPIYGGSYIPTLKSIDDLPWQHEVGDMYVINGTTYLSDGNKFNEVMIAVDELGFQTGLGECKFQTIHNKKLDNLFEFNIFKLDNIQMLNDIIIMDNLLTNGLVNPENIKTEMPTIIITDNENYNSTYLLDIFKEWISECEDENILEKLSNTAIIYIDRVELRLILSDNYVIRTLTIEDIYNNFKTNNIDLTPDSYKDHLERMLPPSIFTINPELKDVGFMKEEALHILNESDAIDSFKYLYQI